MAVFYKCDGCGTVFAALGQSPQPCDMQGMQQVKAAGGQHAPRVEQAEGKVRVSVGKAADPASSCTPEWIYAETSFGGTVVNVEPEGDMTYQLELVPEEVTAVYVYCGEHGLFKTADPVFRPDFETNDVSCSPEWTLGCVNPSEN